MPTINTQDLTGAALDWAVAQAAGVPVRIVLPGNVYPHIVRREDGGENFVPSTNPAQGHPILDRERISLQHLGDRVGWGARWPAWIPDGDGETIPACSGPTMLIAGLRCYVTARLGPAVDVPQELLA